MDQAYKDFILTKVWNFFKQKQKKGQKQLQAKLVSEYVLFLIIPSQSAFIYICYSDTPIHFVENS